jgi:hypothetical protein
MVAHGQSGSLQDYFNRLWNGTFGISIDGGNDGFVYFEDAVVDYSSPVDMGENIDTLQFEVGAAKLTIQPGDAFLITATNVSVKTCEVSGGVWELATGNSSLGSGGEILVTVPKDFALNMELEVGAGTLELGELKAEDLYCSVGAGTVKASLLDVQGEAELEVGLGSFTAGMTQPQSVDIDCGMGSVTLELRASQEAYNIEADCGVGSVHAGTLRIDGVGDQTYTSGNAAGKMNIDCGMGSVRVSFDHQ